MSEKSKLLATCDTTSNTATCDTTLNTVYKLALLAVAVEEDKSEEVDICLSFTGNHILEASQLTSNMSFLHFLYL